MDMLIQALSQGKLCVIDVSQMRGGQSLILSGLILRRIFDRNQQEFTAADPKTIPTIAVVEEAQSVLNENASASEPYVAWVKEGRKYDLGALLITQQPGSIPVEILSQGDNWFLFHLLSAADLGSLKRANAHFSDDLLSSLLNEPIPGQGVFWSSVGGKPYPISFRAESFERLYAVRDPTYDAPEGKTFARTLFDTIVSPMRASAAAPKAQASGDDLFDEAVKRPTVDAKVTVESQAIQHLRQNKKTMDWLQGDQGMPWGSHCSPKGRVAKHSR
ncbi:ATP-binding protein [Mesorhizobium sp. ORM8.1]